MATKLIIDSASDITKQESEKLGIKLMPIIVGFGEEEYLDGVNLTPDEFYSKLKNSHVLPKTSQITSYRFEEEFEKVVRDGDEAIVITISSKLSGTYNQALMASKKYEDKIFVVDSMNACIGERLLGLFAIELIKQGKSASEIKAELENRKSKLRVMAVVDTLEYLKKGGRISSAVAFAGTLLSIKPIIGVVDGEVKMICKAMGMKRGLATLNSLIEKMEGIDFSMPLGIVQSCEKDVVEKYREEISFLWKGNVEYLPDYKIGSTIGTHVGAGALGLAFFEK